MATTTIIIITNATGSPGADTSRTVSRPMRNPPPRLSGIGLTKYSAKHQLGGMLKI